MNHLNISGWLKAILAILLLVTILSAPAIAAVSLDLETNYEGMEAENQAISTELTLSPEDNPIVNATVNIRPTDQSFIDTDSFTTTVDPSSSDAAITYQGNGQFFIDELEPSETIQITFDVYPRTIKQRSLQVATINVEYTQRGQSLTDRERVFADLSSSSYFAWRDAKADLDEQQYFFYFSLLIIGVAAIIVLFKAYEWWTGNGGEGF